MPWKSIQFGFVAVMLAGFALACGLEFGLISFIERLHRGRCPSATFLIGGSSAGIVILPQMMLAFGLGISIVVWAVSLAPDAPTYYDRYAIPANSFSFRGLQKGLAIFTIGSAFIALPLSTIMLFNQFCLTPVGVLDQNSPWSGLKAYPWTEVVQVSTRCTHGKGWGSAYILSLRNGDQIKLSSMTTNGDWVVAYPQLSRALRGGTFNFDHSQVDPRCPLPELQALVHRP